MVNMKCFNEIFEYCWPSLQIMFFRYVLLKERNMLLSMEYNCAKACQLFASPERVDKVNESMERIVKTIQERNSAYWKLEIGEDAPIDLKTNKNELSSDDPLASVRHATELVTQIKSKATLKFEYLLKEKEKKELRKKQRYCFLYLAPFSEVLKKNFLISELLKSIII